MSVSPKILRGALVLMDPGTAAVKRIINLQYNPDSVSRTLQPQGMAEGGDYTDALRIKGPPIETIKLELEIDATDQLEFPEANGTATDAGLHAQLAALESMVYPSSADLFSNRSLADSGTLEIVPMQMPLTVFVWNRNRVVPVKIQDFAITEEAFDAMLNPIRARVSLSMRVLSVSDTGFDHKGAGLFMAYLENKERLARGSGSASLGAIGLQGVL